MKLVKPLILLASLGLLPACTSTMNYGRAISAGSNLVKSATISDAELASLSAQLRQRQDRQNKVAAANSKYTKRLNKLMARLTQVNGRPITYKVYLTSQVNANATADGSVRVFSGLMDIMTDDELRFVIGHEIGHVAKEHVKHQMRNAYLTAAARQAAGIYSTVGVFSDSVLGDVAEQLLKAKFSQSDELEADEYGLMFLKNNGYDLNAALTCLSKLKGSGGFFSTHPSSAERVKNLQRLISN